MLFTRRQFALALLGGIWTSDPLQEIAHTLERATTPGWFTPPDITASVIDIRYGDSRFSKAFGTGTSPETLFVISSITKPMIATAVMVLHDRRELTLQDRVTKFLPEFRGDFRDQVTILHLLNHTAGLPDNLPNGHELLRHGMNLDEFFLQTCKLPLLFEPGSFVSYSNLGVLVAKQIIERVTGISLREFLAAEVFGPLKMNSASLGRTPGKIVSIAENQTRDNPTGHHDEPDFGTPWGGVYSTAADVTSFLHYFTNPGRGPLRPDTARNMLQNQNQGLNQPWGIGWMLAYSHDVYYKVSPNWRRYGWATVFGNPERLPAFGVNCSPSAFGHYGVTGTLAWADPERHISLVLLTTKKVRHSRDGVLGPISDVACRLK
jgi:CubicO group peptidase (beta-lactamase class C family)